MKNTGKCPKCESTDIIKIPRNNGAIGLGNGIMTGWAVMSAIWPLRFVCGQCGFIEEWIDKKEEVEKLRKKYGS